MGMRYTVVSVALATGIIGLMSSAANAVVQKYTITFSELNSSGVSGGGMITHDTSTNTLHVMYSAMGLDEGTHAQHIHGLLASGPGSAPADSTTPTLADDSDGDGFVETLEGVPKYGDVLLSLFGTPGDTSTFPVVGADGLLDYDVTFDLGDSSIFTPSPATGITYSAVDLMPLEFREVVIHGGNVAAGAGGGMFEVDGTQPAGFVPFLPVAAAEITAAPVPVPAAIWSMAAAGGLLVAMKRRKQGSTSA